MGILLVGILLGVIVIPIVQGRSAGLDAYTAICRALGILPGSPAQPQPADKTPPTPVSQVIWTPEVLQILARADVAKGRAKVQEVCVACHGETGISPSRRNFRTLRDNLARRFTNNFTTTGLAAACIL